MRLPEIEPLESFSWDEGPLLALVRHGQTEVNAARQRGDLANDFIQGMDTKLSEKGRQQGARFGRVFRQYADAIGLQLHSIHTSDMKRAIDSRFEGVRGGALQAPMYPPTPLLRELYKGDLIGKRRLDVYTEDEYYRSQNEDWHFRHGSKESGGETAAEAGDRLRRWCDMVHSGAPKLARTAILAFTHGQVTAYGLTQLFAGDHLPEMLLSKPYRLSNGNALLVAKRRGNWALSYFEANPPDKKR